MTEWHAKAGSWGLLIVLSVLLAGVAGRPAHADLQLNAAGPAPELHGEPQVKLDCAASTLKITPCTTLSAEFRDWINSRAGCFLEGYAAATGATDVPQSVMLGCLGGIYAPRKTRTGGRWSQHRYRRACDGRKILVGEQSFNYNAAVKAARNGSIGDPHLKFYLAFLDCWGPPGPGMAPDGSIVYDANRGVRDWREDPRGHSGHYHLSVPCVTCIFGEMAYE